MSAFPDQNANTYWIASYPKSGNTWVRLFLENYLGDRDTPLHINALPSGNEAYLRRHFDALLGVETADFPPEFLQSLRPRCYDAMAAATAKADRPRFVKTHEAFTRTCGGEPVFSARSTAGAILILRNPLDVVVSLSHFLRLSIDAAIERLCDETRVDTPALTESIPHHTGGWSSFALSWLNAGIPLHVLRYEDLLEQPEVHFGAALRFLNLDVHPERLARAVAHSSFDRLQAQEARDGFAAMRTGADAFFREGRKDGWQTMLSGAQVAAVVKRHESIMQRFGYLPESA